MPVFNEAATVVNSLRRVLAQTCVLEVIVIDDGSTDGTFELVQAIVKEDERVSLLRHVANRGKGASIRTALNHVKAPIIIIQDADLEYDPSDYSRLLEPLLRGDADVVYGSRFMIGALPHTIWWHVLQNRLLTAVANLVTGLKLTDEATCYKVFRREVIDRIELKENRFGFCPEFTVKISQLGLRIKEVPISYSARTSLNGKKLRFCDGLDAIRCLLKFAMFRQDSRHRPVVNSGHSLGFSKTGRKSCVNVKVLHRADRWLGVPFCFVLTLARKILSCFPAGHLEARRSLLFVKLAEQGSTVLAYSALKRACESLGTDNVFFVTFEDNRFILDVLNVIPQKNVLTISVRGMRDFLWSAGITIWRLQRLKLGTAIDMEFFSRGSAALTYLSGAKRLVGFHAFFGAGPYRGDLMTHRLIYNAHLHTSETFAALVEVALSDPGTLPSLDMPIPRVDDSPPKFAARPEELAAVLNMLGCQKNQPLILLNPNSGDLLPLRRWPSERYAELASRLLERHPELLIVFTGAPGEASECDNLVRQVNSNRCISLAGKTTLRQLLALYTIADVLVTNDSGPAHFATLTPIRVITLFGPETPELFAARTPRNTVLWAKLPCSPCVNAYNNRRSPCRDNLCMQAIALNDVFIAVNSACDLGKLARCDDPSPDSGIVNP